MGHWNNSQNAYYWVGGAFEVTAADPIRFYADVIYGAGATTDSKSAKRQGWFVDAGVEYTGLDMLAAAIRPLPRPGTAKTAKPPSQA